MPFEGPLAISARRVMVWFGLGSFLAEERGLLRTCIGQNEGVRASAQTFPDSFPVDFVSQEERPGGPSGGFGVTEAIPACRGAYVD